MPSSQIMDLPGWCSVPTSPVSHSICLKLYLLSFPLKFLFDNHAILSANVICVLWLWSFHAVLFFGGSIFSNLSENTKWNFLNSFLFPNHFCLFQDWLFGFLCLRSVSVMLQVSSHVRWCSGFCLYLGSKAWFTFLGRHVVCSLPSPGLLHGWVFLPCRASLTSRLHFEEHWGPHEYQRLSYTKSSLKFSSHPLCSFKFIHWQTF